MSKKTSFYCDFNPVLPEHEAQFRITRNDSAEGIGRGCKEFCESHIAQAVVSQFDPSAPSSVTVERFAPRPENFKPVTGVPGEKKPCEYCGALLQPQSVAAHNRRTHGMFSGKALVSA